MSTSTLPRHDENETIDPYAVAEQFLAGHASEIAARLDAVAEALVECRTKMLGGEQSMRKIVVLHLYDSDLITKAQAYKFGNFEPEEFYDALDEHRRLAPQ